MDLGAVIRHDLKGQVVFVKGGGSNCVNTTSVLQRPVHTAQTIQSFSLLLIDLRGGLFNSQTTKTTDSTLCLITRKVNRNYFIVLVRVINLGLVVTLVNVTIQYRNTYKPTVTVFTVVMLLCRGGHEPQNVSYENNIKVHECLLACFCSLWQPGLVSWKQSSDSGCKIYSIYI